MTCNVILSNPELAEGASEDLMLKITNSFIILNTQINVIPALFIVIPENAGIQEIKIVFTSLEFYKEKLLYLLDSRVHGE